MKKLVIILALFLVSMTIANAQVYRTEITSIWDNTITLGAASSTVSNTSATFSGSKIKLDCDSVGFIFEITSMTTSSTLTKTMAANLYLQPLSVNGSMTDSTNIGNWKLALSRSVNGGYATFGNLVAVTPATIMWFKPWLTVVSGHTLSTEYRYRIYIVRKWKLR